VSHLDTDWDRVLIIAPSSGSKCWRSWRRSFRTKITQTSRTGKKHSGRPGPSGELCLMCREILLMLRLEGCQRDVEVWQRILQVRSLVLTPTESMDTWIAFADLCRDSDRLNLAEKTLTSLVGSSYNAQDPEVSSSRRRRGSKRLTSSLVQEPRHPSSSPTSAWLGQKGRPCRPSRLTLDRSTRTDGRRCSTFVISRNNSRLISARRAGMRPAS
jgi:hypothetical protein